MALPEGETQVEIKRVMGTYGYMAPEVLSSGVYSEKSDIFGFSSLLLDLLMGNRYGAIEFFEHYTPSYIRNHLMNEIVDLTILAEAEAGGVIQYHHQLQAVYQLGLE